jgi:hypothetical protein
MYHLNICLLGLKKAQKLRIGGLWDEFEHRNSQIQITNAGRPVYMAVCLKNKYLYQNVNFIIELTQHMQNNAEF